MTKKLFWQNPYQTRLVTSINQVAGTHVTLDETIFYAFSGGQESDRGTICNYTVLEARKNGQEIEYTLTSDHHLQPGDTVVVDIDWLRRYKLMRLHFAAELILELTYRTVPGIQKIGAHIAEDKSRIDFESATNIASLLPSLKQDADKLIHADHPVISAFSDEANERRYWEIAGFARVPCGGTHIQHTGEIGPIELKRKNVGKGKERIEIFLIS